MIEHQCHKSRSNVNEDMSRVCICKLINIAYVCMWSPFLSRVSLNFYVLVFMYMHGGQQDLTPVVEVFQMLFERCIILKIERYLSKRL